jgi:ISXO2-like transposase domain
VPFIQDTVAAGAQVHTDGSPAYRSLTERGYDHRPTVLLSSPQASRSRAAARGPSRSLSAAALDPRHPSWSGPTGPSGRLPG